MYNQIAWFVATSVAFKRPGGWIWVVHPSDKSSRLAEGFRANIDQAWDRLAGSSSGSCSKGTIVTWTQPPNSLRWSPSGWWMLMVLARLDIYDDQIGRSGLIILPKSEATTLIRG